MPHTPKKALALVTDAFGGRGGIALYARNLLQALCSYPGMERVVVLPRQVTYNLEKMPDNLEYRAEAAGTKLRYACACLSVMFSERHFDLILCSHLHLLPFAQFLGFFYRCPVIPVVYGVEAWTRTPHWIVNSLCRGLRFFISISRLTALRLIQWAGLKHQDYYYLPNAIDGSQYGMKPRRTDLMERYGTVNKTVVMTAGRLDPGALDVRKGFDEVIEVLPALKTKIPNVMYLIMGDGEDKARLLEKAEKLGVKDIVRCTGYVPDAEKADHYRLADVFAMPGSSPIFDRYPYRFVFLEALACGVPVVGCKLEDPYAINDPDARLIIQVDPNNPEDVVGGIMEALKRPKGILPPGIEKYDLSFFVQSFHGILQKTLAGGRP